jgi:hypothetical protein
MPSYESLEPARLAIGDTRRLADRIGLVDMSPVGELTSTGYALANPGLEYVALQPSDAGEGIAIQLPAGTYEVEWFRLGDREWTASGRVSVADEERTTLHAPLESGPAVIHLLRENA